MRSLTLLLFSFAATAQPPDIPLHLPGTRPLQMQADWPEEQRREILGYLDRGMHRAQARRDARWKEASRSPQAWRRTVLAERGELRRMLGIEAHSGATLRHEGDEIVVTASDGFRAHALLADPGGTAAGVTLAVPPQNQGPEVFLRSRRARELLRSGQVLAVPFTVPRDESPQIAHITKRLPGADRRRVLHRLALVVGRTLPGLEVAQLLAIRDALKAQPRYASLPFQIHGEEQGGMTALIAGALDPSFSRVEANGYFGASESAAEQPFDRMLYGQLPRFGEAELAALVAPRLLTVADGAGPEIARARDYYRAAGAESKLRTPPGTEPAPNGYTNRDRLAIDANFATLHAYLLRQVDASEQRRERYWRLTGSSPLAASARIRAELARWMGVPGEAPAPLQPRSRLLRVTGRFLAYEVMLGALDGVHVYGHLLIPRQRTGRLPAIICQHGLNGQPKDVTGLGEIPSSVYHEFGARLAESGYVVFAPYLAVPSPQREKINPMVRRAAALGMLRTAIEVRKLRSVVDYLEAMPFVDREHIGYYGLSYGGYSALWMAPLEARLRAVIVSGHFNDWRSKIADNENPISFQFHPDEDFFNWNVLHRFTHPELIAAMYPRAVMVEYATRDRTTTPEWHERAWRQVAAVARAWGAGERVERDVFDGVHEIGGGRALEFAARWLKPADNPARSYTYMAWPPARSFPEGEGTEDALPFSRVELGSGGLAELRGTFHVGGSRPWFRGVALRLSRVDQPAPLTVCYGFKPGSRELGCGRIAPGEVTPLFDLWHDAPIAPVRVVPGRRYHLTIALEGSGRYTVYGKKQLGGRTLPGHFPFAYRLIDPHKAGTPQDAFEFVREYLRPPAIPRFPAAAAETPQEILLRSGEWGIEDRTDDVVAATAAARLTEFLKTCCRVELRAEAPRRVVLETKASVDGVTSREGFAVNVTSGGVRISAIDARGTMRGLYWLEDQFLSRRAPVLKPGTTIRNAAFQTRITTSIYPGGLRYTEASRPFLYTDGLLQRISRDGFNAVWIWLNLEEAAHEATVFPELANPQSGVCLARIEDLARRARRFGIDVYAYLATNYNHPPPESFFAKHPAARGAAGSGTMCTSYAPVRQYQAEVVRHVVQAAPGIKGFIVIYDSEGFYYCGNRPANRDRCPRCRHFTSEQLAHGLLTNLNDAMHQAGGPSKELIAFSYSRNTDWMLKLFPRLPKDIRLALDFSKESVVERDGIRHTTGDYNLTAIGPPDKFFAHHEAARRLGLEFIIKTEHAVSQEFIFVPYIPAMNQWLGRIARMREFPNKGWFGNWCHYGYLASLPAQLFSRLSFDPAPEGDSALRELAAGHYGDAAAPLVLAAWKHFSEGIRRFPYSDSMVRIPGPMQRGPSHPFFLDPGTPSFGRWRVWQNDLQWTRPWGPEIAARHLGATRESFRLGIAELERARALAGDPIQREALAGEWRIARTIESSLHTMLNLIAWMEERDRAGSSPDVLRSILLDERRNVLEILPVLESDSRLGFASEGGGVVRGGLFTPELVRWKLGQIEDVLVRQLSAHGRTAGGRSSSSAMTVLPR